MTAGNKTRSSGEAIVMSPVLSWLLFPSGCAASFDQIHDAVAEIERLSGLLAPQPAPVRPAWRPRRASRETQVPVVHLWSGKDNETSNLLDAKTNATCTVPPIYQGDWLRDANVVPASCL